MQEQIKNLIRKHIDNSINKVERNELRKAVSTMTDDELGSVLSEIWIECNISTPRTDFEQLVESLGIQPEKKTRRLFLRIAAAIIAVLFAGSSVWYHHENDRLNQFLNKDITVTVKSGEKADMTLPDGSSISLNSATTMTYPSNFGYDERSVRVVGEAYLKVSKNKDVPFYVNTDYLQIEVLGTEFNIATYDNLIETTLLEGSIKLTTKDAKRQTIILSPNEKAVYDKKTGQLDVEKTTTRFETAWTRGELVFRSTDFQHIMSKLMQRYGVEITIEGKMDKDLFTGSFKENTVFDVLKKLQIHYKFKYQTMNDNKIMIMFN
jgi:ferric-dicitrate binding protein FerR (iron transport regulator)